MRNAILQQIQQNWVGASFTSSSYDDSTSPDGTEIIIGGIFMSVDFDVFFRNNEKRIHYQIHRIGITGSWYRDFYSEGIVAGGGVREV